MGKGLNARQQSSSYKSTNMISSWSMSAAKSTSSGSSSPSPMAKSTHARSSGTRGARRKPLTIPSRRNFSPSSSTAERRGPHDGPGLGGAPARRARLRDGRAPIWIYSLEDPRDFDYASGRSGFALIPLGSRRRISGNISRDLYTRRVHAQLPRYPNTA